jgi:GNAT superfamily N-acetyltransferase
LRWIRCRVAKFLQEAISDPLFRQSRSVLRAAADYCRMMPTYFGAPRRAVRGGATCRAMPNIQPAQKRDFLKVWRPEPISPDHVMRLEHGRDAQSKGAILVLSGSIDSHARPMNAPNSIRLCRDDEFQDILTIVNAAAEAYRGAIPDDCWHDPYMPADELRSEIAAGVVFWGYEADGILVGVMGIQPVLDVDLIRHAYVLPTSQRRGIGGALLEHLQGFSKRRLLIGTWAAAEWAIRFYLDHGFELVPSEQKVTLLKRYWAVPDRQIETSVVLANPPLG